MSIIDWYVFGLLGTGIGTIVFHEKNDVYVGQWNRLRPHGRGKKTYYSTGGGVHDGYWDRGTFSATPFLHFYNL